MIICSTRIPPHATHIGTYPGYIALTVELLVTAAWMSSLIETMQVIP